PGLPIRHHPAKNLARLPRLRIACLRPAVLNGDALAVVKRDFRLPGRAGSLALVLLRLGEGGQHQHRCERACVPHRLHSSSGIITKTHNYERVVPGRTIAACRFTRIAGTNWSATNS